MERDSNNQKTAIAPHIQTVVGCKGHCLSKLNTVLGLLTFYAPRE